MKKLSVTFAIICSGLTFWQLILVGEFDSLQMVNAPRCEKILQLTGAEDMAIDYEHRHIYVSVDDRRSILQGKEILGGLAVVNTKVTPTVPRSLSLIDQQGQPILSHFHPHGIDFIMQSNRGYLWVVNHPYGFQRSAESGQPSHTIELFEIDDLKHPQRLTRVKQLSHTVLSSPNDLVALSTNELYVTNDHRSTNIIMKMYELLTHRSWGNIVHFKSDTWQLAYKGIAFANGVEITPNHKNIVVASANGDGLQLLTRMTNGTLKWKQTLAVSRSIDNLTWDRSEQQLYMSTHPKSLRFVLHALSEGWTSPTESIQVTYHQATQMLESPKLILDSRVPISGGSVTIREENELWLGSVFEPFIIKCVL